MTLERLAPALFVLLWSTGWVVAKFAIDYADPLTFLALRFAIAGILFYAVSRLAGIAFPRGRAALAALISGIFLQGLYLGMLWWAIGAGVPPGISGIIAGLQPLMTGIGAALILRERLSRLQQAGLALGFVGIAIAVLPKILAADQPVPAFAAAVNVLGMACVSYGAIYQKQHVRQGDLRAIAVLQNIGAVAVTLPAALILEPMRVAPGLGLALTLGWSVIGISVGAMALLLYLIRRGSVAKAASLIYLVPPLAALEAVAAFGEAVSPAMAIGTVIAVFGVYLTNRNPGGEQSEKAA